MSRATSPITTIEYIHTCYEEVKKTVIGSGSSAHVWITNCGRNVGLIGGFIQICTDRTGTTLKNTPLVAYPVHTNLQMPLLEEEMVDR